ncbi:hypothetical protein I4U23_000013 [Adineta vaga]|nr:hypothetical protein I4U23_000013 [Adineta vaga]
MKSVRFCRKKANRLKQNNFYRRMARLKCSSSTSLCDTFSTEESMPNKISSQNLTLLDEQASTKTNITSASSLVNIDEQRENRETESIYSTYESSNFDNIFFRQQISDLTLHPYTTGSCYSFTKTLVTFIRKANISKRHANYLIGLIYSSLPQPNTFPKSYSGLLILLSGSLIDFAFFLSIENLFVKRIVCISCGKDLLMSSKKCWNCPDNKPKHLATIFDSLQEALFTQVYDRLSSVINSYREQFTNQPFDDESNDIIYNQNYKFLYDSTHHTFISIILHLDGIPLGKSLT